MADKKISELNDITGANTAADDEFVIVDTSAGETKRITRAELTNALEIGFNELNTDLDLNSSDITGTGNINITGTVTADELNLNSAGDIHSTVDTSYVAVAGGTNTNVGANVSFYGGSHSSLANVTRFRTGSTERMRIDSSGNVGIGTTSPDEALQVAAAGKIKASRSDNARSLLLYTDNSAATVESDTDPLKLKSADRISFETGGANERMRITSTGNVGIGTSSPDTNLNIGFSGADDSNTFRIEGSNGSSERYAFDIEANGENAKTFFKIGSGGGAPSTKMTLTSTGNVGIGTASPSNPLHIDHDGTAMRIVRGSAIGFLYNVGSASSSNFRIQSNGGGLDFYYGSSGAVTFTDNGTERVRLTSGGHLVAGATSAASGLTNLIQLQASGTNGGIVINSQGTAATNYSRLMFTKSNSTGNEGLIRYNTNDYHMSFWTNATEKLRLTSDGKLGLGTSSPLSPLHITSSGDEKLRLTRSSNTIYFSMSSAASGGWGFYDASRSAFDLYAKNGNVGIGTSSPDTDLHVEQSGHAKIKVESTGTNASIVIHADSGGDNKGHFRIGGDPTSSGGLFIYDETNSAERLRIENGGDVRVKTGNLVIDGAGKGIFVGGTAAGNHLDDYEEGTFTPTARGSTTNGVATYTTQTGIYVKIGRLVFVQGYIVVTGWTTTPSGHLEITGNPYLCSPSTSAVGTVMTNNLDHPGSNPVSASLYMGANGYSWRIYMTNDNASWTPTQAQNEAWNIYYSVSYYTNQ